MVVADGAQHISFIAEMTAVDEITVEFRMPHERIDFPDNKGRRLCFDQTKHGCD